MPLSTLAAAVFSTLPLSQSSRIPPEQVIQAAATLGIDAHTMACAGVHGSEVAELLNRLREDFQDYLSYIDALEDQADARGAIFLAKAALRLDLADTEAVGQLTAAESALQAANTHAAQRREALILSLTNGFIDASCREAVFGCSPLMADVPAEFRYASGSHDEARVLAWAVRLRERVGPSDLPLEASAALAAAEGMIAVQTARLWRTTQSTPNQLAIEQWTLTD